MMDPEVSRMSARRLSTRRLKRAYVKWLKNAWYVQEKDADTGDLLADVRMVAEHCKEELVSRGVFVP